jgi:hypothetical protein
MSEGGVLFQDQATNRDGERRKRMTVNMSSAAGHGYVRLSLNHHVHEDGRATGLATMRVKMQECKSTSPLLDPSLVMGKLGSRDRAHDIRKDGNHWLAEHLNCRTALNPSEHRTSTCNDVQVADCY